MNIECSYCYEPASFFYQDIISGSICCACAYDNKIFFTEILYSKFKIIKREKAINILVMKEALE